MSSYENCPKCPDCGSCYSLTCKSCIQGGTTCVCGWISPEQQAYLDRYYEDLEEHNRQVAEDIEDDQLRVHSDDCDCPDCIGPEPDALEEVEPDRGCRLCDPIYGCACEFD